MKLYPCLLAAVWATSALARIETTPDLPSEPLTLEQVLAEALMRNPELKAAKARIEQAEARLEEANAAFWPQLKASVRYTHTNDPSRAFGFIVAQRRFDFSMDINRPGFVEDFRPEVSVTWSLFRGGQDWFLRQAAKLGIEAAAAETIAVRNRLAEAVCRAFYAFLATPEEIKVAERTRATVARELELTRARVQQGIALKSDLLSLEVRLAQANETKIQAHNAQEAARTALATLLALPSHTPIAVRNGDRPLPLAGEFESWLDQALTARPELKAAAKEIEARERLLRAAQGARFPQVNAFVTYGFNAPSPSFPTSRDNWTMGVQAELDLFSGGAISARIHRAKKGLEEAKAQAEHLRLAAEQEVRQAWLSLRAALARLEVADRALAAAESALRQVTAQYRAGGATVTRFLEAETDFSAAHLEQISARFGAFTAEAQLKRAAGLLPLEPKP
ncbi:MAG: TolC family protein [Methylohalobius sp.]|nr:TolC family protein [Methylohalobius sp.]